MFSNLFNTPIPTASTTGTGGGGLGIQIVSFREQFTGDGATTQFQLNGTIENATFAVGSWAAANVKIALKSHAVNQQGTPIYDSIVPLVRNRISVVSISATGLVTLSHAPRNAVDFDLWYFYETLTTDQLTDYFREDFVASMEADYTDIESRLEEQNGKVSISSNDTTPGYLNDKLIDGSDITYQETALGNQTKQPVLTNTPVVPGTYNSVTVDAKGRVTTATAENYIDDSEKGQPNGVASLDGGGKVPSAQLPAYVDDVLEFVDLASFPGTGESGKIYIALDTNKTYRWSGATYVDISPSSSTPQATESLLGGAEIATQTETNAGVDNTRMITPSKLAGWWVNIKTLTQTIANFWTFDKGIILGKNPPSSYQEGKIEYNQQTNEVDFHTEINDVRVGLTRQVTNKARNSSGSLINKGEVVYITGYHAGSGLPEITTAKADALITSKAIGIAMHNIANNAEGYTLAFGLLSDLNTTGCAIGDELFLSETTAGAIKNSRPNQPNFTAPVGVCLRSHASNGSVFVNISGRKFGAFSNKAIAFGGTDGFIKENSNFTYDAATQTLKVKHIDSDTTTGNDTYGDGSDGVVDFDGTNTFSFAAKSGNTYTLNRDLFSTYLIVQSGVTLEPNGFRIFANSPTLSINDGDILGEGNNGSNGVSATEGAGGAGGASTPSGTLGGGSAGGAGGTGGSSGKGGNAPTAGINGGTIASSQTTGTGGDGESGAGGGALGGSGGAKTVIATIRFYTHLFFYTALATNIRSGTGGGGGGGGLDGSGGGGGGGGGRRLGFWVRNFENNGTISVNGGNGGNGGTTGDDGGKGAGGQAGDVYMVYNNFENNGTITATGGLAGTTGAGTGENGADGLILKYNRLKGIWE